MTRKRRRDLTEADQVLWDQITKKVKPLKKAKRQAISQSVKVPPLIAKPTSFPSPAKEILIPVAPVSSSTHRIQRVRKVKIEARLDLHGFTSMQAHVHLERFLMRCQMRGYLWVLVITGKGRREQEQRASSPGVLQQLVPQWLDEPPLRIVVSAYTIAKSQDGGRGALYVRLKRSHITTKSMFL